MEHEGDWPKKYEYGIKEQVKKIEESLKTYPVEFRLAKHYLSIMTREEFRGLFVDREFTPFVEKIYKCKFLINNYYAFFFKQKGSKRVR